MEKITCLFFFYSSIIYIENALKHTTGTVTNWDEFIFELKDIVTDVGDLYGHIKGAKIDVDEFLNDQYLILKATPASMSLILTDIGSILDKKQFNMF